VTGEVDQAKLNHILKYGNRPKIEEGYHPKGPARLLLFYDTISENSER
jgi:hypothetical protein